MQPRTVPIKLHLIGGFLGAGKTTLLRRLLGQGLYGERVVVLVNEFGDVGIDGALLRKGGNEVVELSSGCVCCQIGKDMLASVFQMIREYAPERIVIELTGVAEPGRVLSSLAYSSELMEKARLEPTICVVDCFAFPNMTKEMEYYFYCQAQAADIVLLNKADLVDAARLTAVEAAVRACSPRAFFFPTHHCDVDLHTLFDAHAAAGQPRRGPCGHVHADGASCLEHDDVAPLFDSFVWRDAELTFDRARVEAWVERLPASLFRVKGTVRLAEGLFFLNWVKGSPTWEPAASGDPEPTTLVFIGRGVQAQDVDEGLRACRKMAARGLRLSGQGGA